MKLLCLAVLMCGSVPSASPDWSFDSSEPPLVSAEVRNFSWTALTPTPVRESSLEFGKPHGDGDFVIVQITDEARLARIANAWRHPTRMIKRDEGEKSPEYDFRMVAILKFADGIRHTVSFEITKRIVFRDGVPHVFDEEFFEMLMAVVPKEHR